MTNYLEFKNVSTIITSVLLTVFGALLGYLSSMGLNLPITAEALSSIVCALILAVFSYYNAKNHNNLFDEEEDTVKIPVDLTTEQVNSIQNFIAYQTGENISINGEPAPNMVEVAGKTYNKFNDSQQLDYEEEEI